MAVYIDRARDAAGNLISETVWDSEAQTKNGNPVTGALDVKRMQQLRRNERADLREERIARLLDRIDTQDVSGTQRVADVNRRVKVLERLVRDLYRRIEGIDDETVDNTEDPI